MDLELADETREGHMLSRRDVLIPKEDHLALDEQRVEKITDRRRGQNPEIDAVNDAPEGRREVLEREAVFHGTGIQ
jgi:hypothetical protein